MFLKISVRKTIVPVSQALENNRQILETTPANISKARINNPVVNKLVHPKNTPPLATKNLNLDTQQHSNNNTNNPTKTNQIDTTILDKHKEIPIMLTDQI